jgi:toxin ParE1/3/4
VSKGPRFKVLVTGPARRDIAAIIRWSFSEFGEAAAHRYEALILQALRDLASDPERPGSKERPEIMAPGTRTYHLSLSRSRMAGKRVKAPRHFLFYRSIAPGVIEIVRVLHDSRDLAQHLPPELQSNN